MVADLNSYHKLSAIWPATRIGCALLSMVKDAEIGLGSTMKRFQHVNKLRRENGLPPENKEQFHTLVRSATDHVSKAEYSEAHVRLEELFVLMGEAPVASRLLP